MWTPAWEASPGCNGVSVASDETPREVTRDRAEGPTPVAYARESAAAANNGPAPSLAGAALFGLEPPVAARAERDEVGGVICSALGAGNDVMRGEIVRETAVAA
jgi:hypothetical protein